MIEALDYISAPEIKKLEQWGSMKLEYFDSNILDLDFNFHLDLNKIENFVYDELKNNIFQ